MAEVLGSRIDVATYVALPRSLDEPGALSELAEMLDAFFDSGDIHLVLDFGNVTLVNSAALELLLDTHERLAQAGGELKIAHANPTVQEVFSLTHLDRHIKLVSGAERGAMLPVPTERPRRLGERLVERGLVTEEVVREAVELQRSTGKRLGDILVDRGVLKETDLLDVLGEQLALPFVRLRAGLFDPDVLALLGAENARRLNVLPLFKVRDVVYVATSDPHATPTLETVEELTGCKAKSVLASATEIEKQLVQAAEAHAARAPAPSLELAKPAARALRANAAGEMVAASPVNHLVDELLEAALREGASDVHIEPCASGSRVRLRVDGVLQQMKEHPREMHAGLVSRLKAMARVDIGERKLPQEGRIETTVGERELGLRLISLPGVHGEKVVLKVLARPPVPDLNALGMSRPNLDAFARLLEAGRGLVLVTGPVDTGKTTTLYATLKHLSSVHKSIVSVEERVEQHLELVHQNEVGEGPGLGFAEILAHVVQQEPDVIMLGDLPDAATARLALQGALGGALVLAAMRASDTAEAVNRLLDMGVERYLLASALSGGVSQRLVRKVCSACRTSFLPAPGLLERYGVGAGEGARLARGHGCPSCHHSGYRGRAALHAVFECGADTQRVLLSGPTRAALAAHVAERAASSLRAEALDKALRGESTLEEVARVAPAVWA